MEVNGSTCNSTNAKVVEYVAIEDAQDVTIKPGSDNDEKPWKLKGCNQKRTTLEKALLLLLLIVILLCIFLVVILIVNSRSGGANTCMTSGCVQLAGTILSNMDPTADPCSDFYQFSCGGWEMRNKIPEDRSRVNVLDMLQDNLMYIVKDLLEEPVNSSEISAVSKAKHFYKSCKNEETIDERSLDPLRNMLLEFGGWPVTGDGVFDETTWDLVDTITIIRKTLSQHALFQTDPKFEDIIDKEFYRLRIDQNRELGMGHREFYLADNVDQAKADAYRLYMARLAAEMRPDRDQEEAMRQMNETYEFETELAKIHVSDAERADLLSMINRMSISNLTETTRTINWLKYFQNIVSEDITNDTIVFNFSPKYFEKLGALIERTPKRVIANFLMIRVTMDAADYLSTKIRQIRRDFMRIKTGEMADKPRWQTCAREVNEVLPQAVGALFVSNHFSEESKLTANEMYKNIRQVFIETLEKTSWMDVKTQEKALEKIQYVDELIGYVGDISSNSKLNELYGEIDLSPDTYFENVVMIITNTAKRESALFGKPINASDPDSKWDKYSPVSANAWYYAPINSIFVPAGILQPPFYSKDYPKYANYGGIGMVLGHEFTHGFDTRGNRFGKDGRLEEWWSEDSRNSYQERAECLQEQYSKFYLPEIDAYVDGARSQSENIADNGGLKAAFLGYKKWIAENGEERIQLPGLNYTTEQMFFINFGQIWCGLHTPEDLKISRFSQYAPSKFRVIGTVSNSVYFADTFKCPAGSPMNPQDKCELW